MLICGAGGHARVVIDILKDEEINVQAIFGKDEGIVELDGIPILNDYDPAYCPEELIIVATGDNHLRKRIAEEVNHTFGKAIHHSALISSKASVSSGSVIIHNSVVQTNAVIGNHVIINTSASVDHDCKVGDYVHISPNVTLCGGVEVGEGTLIGAGSVIIPNKKIGKWSVIGAGSVVIEDIPDYCLAVGNPARVVKKLRPDE